MHLADIAHDRDTILDGLTLELALLEMDPVACDAPLPWSSAITDDELTRLVAAAVPGAVRASRRAS